MLQNMFQKCIFFCFIGMRDSIIVSEEKVNLEKNKLKRGGGVLNEYEYFLLIK